MKEPTFTIHHLLEAGVHFGHHPRRWNPKMAPFIYGVRNKVHILDLRKTVPMLHAALKAITETVSQGGRVLFVATKRQAAHKVAEAAKACGQYYVNHRWLGGTLTNWQTISQSIKRLEELQAKLSPEGSAGLTKKESLKMTREKQKLDLALGGIASMGGRPDLVVVFDTDKEALAVEEAYKLGIPVVGIIDTNSCPDKITFPIPGNDDASRSIDLYCKLFVEAVVAGLRAEITDSSADLGAAEEVAEPVLEDVKEMLADVPAELVEAVVEAAEAAIPSEEA
ncbi:MAG: 30S ribosomal protein S2 [Alphaproteobacteria bacterium]